MIWVDDKELNDDLKDNQLMKFVRQLEKLDKISNNRNAGDDQLCLFWQFLKNERNEAKIFSRKYNGIIKNGKL